MKIFEKLSSRQRNILITGIILGFLVVVGFGIAVGGGFVLINKTKKATTIQSSFDPLKPDLNAIFIPPVLKNFTSMNQEPNTKVSWNPEPVKIDNQGLVLGYAYGQTGDFSGNTYTLDQYNKTDEYQYFQLGKHGDNTIILALLPAVDMNGPAMMFFEKTPSGDYIFMQKMSTYSIYYGSGYYSIDYQPPVLGDSYAGYALSSAKVKSTNTTTFYEGITGPQTLNYQGLKLEQYYLYIADLFSNYLNQKGNVENASVKKIASLNEGDLYVYEQASRSLESQDAQLHGITFYIKKYVLRTPSGFYTEYTLDNGFVPEEYIPALITWNDGSANKYFFDPAAGLAGCANPGSYAITKDDISSKIKPTGTTKSKETIYEFKDINEPILQYFYQYWGGKEYESSEPQPVSLQTWYQDHAVIVHKNNLGEFEILLNEKYGMTEGCGKPVIYLYPTQTMPVSVKVGASVTVSEPQYRNGWSVEAHPDGSLKNADGKIYPYLFWEGIGNGIYPTINKGFVVKRENIENTLKSHLAMQGLTQKEANDFMDFWLLKMPKTPYIRLTWLSTQEVNEMAPLVIWPKPETTMRIFLDFEGLEKNISLPSQSLTAIPRKGFTVVEWGGILRR